MPVAHFQQLTIWFALMSHIIRNMHHRCRMNWEIHLGSLGKGSVPECPTWSIFLNSKRHQSCLQPPSEGNWGQLSFQMQSICPYDLPKGSELWIDSWDEQEEPSSSVEREECVSCSSVRQLSLHFIFQFFRKQSHSVNSPDKRYLVKITDWLFFQGLQGRLPVKCWWEGKAWDYRCLNAIKYDNCACFKRRK